MYVLHTLQVAIIDSEKLNSRGFNDQKLERMDIKLSIEDWRQLYQLRQVCTVRRRGYVKSSKRQYLIGEKLGEYN